MGDYLTFFSHVSVLSFMRRLDADLIVFSFLILGGIGIIALFSNPLIGSIILFGASCIVLYGWLDMTAEIRDSLAELNNRITEKESNEEIED